MTFPEIHRTGRFAWNLPDSAHYLYASYTSNSKEVEGDIFVINYIKPIELYLNKCKNSICIYPKYMFFVLK